MGLRGFINFVSLFSSQWAADESADLIAWIRICVPIISIQCDENVA